MKLQHYWMLIVLIIVIAVALVLVIQNNRSTKDIDPELLRFTYEKPKWLEGHPKQRIIEKYIEEQKKKIMKRAADYRREFPNLNNLLPYVLKITLERVVLDQDKYESILITHYEYTGGAHSNTEYIYYTTSDSKDVSITEYLAYRGYSEEQLMARVNKRLQLDEHDTIESFSDVPWQVHVPNSDNPIGIRIIFPPYAVAAFSVGTITYTF